MKVIRAKRGIWVPLDPEKPDSRVRLVDTGLIAIVPSGYQLEKDSYEEIQRIKIQKKDN